MSLGPDQLGRPLRDLRISVIDQCNFRCTYCMPAEIFGPEYAFLPRNELLTFDEIERLARIFAEFGATKLRLTGGEPLLRKDLPDLIARLLALPGIEDIALTTNGVLLPRLAAPLRAAGLSRLTVSLDALDPVIFGKMNGRGVSADKVLAGIAAAQAEGFAVKVNCVVERGVNETEIRPLVRQFARTGVTVRFIEFMDVGNHNRWKMDRVFSAKEILEEISLEFPVDPLPPRYPGEVACRYRFREFGGEVGIIASVTAPFCQNCSRARLSADGSLYTCLFASEGWDLRELLRTGWTDDQLRAHLTHIWTHRHDRYSEERAGLLAAHKHLHKVEMSYIGG